MEKWIENLAKKHRPGEILKERFRGVLKGKYKCKQCGEIVNVHGTEYDVMPFKLKPFTFEPDIHTKYRCDICGALAHRLEGAFEKVPDTYQEHEPTMEELIKEVRVREERAKAILNRKCILCGASNPQRGVATRRLFDLEIRFICQNCVEAVAKGVNGPDLIVLEVKGDDVSEIK